MRILATLFFCCYAFTLSDWATASEPYVDDSLLRASLGGRPLGGTAIKPTVFVVRPPSWSHALSDWKRYREKRYRVVELDALGSAAQIRLSVLKAAAIAERPNAVVLCGDVALPKDGDDRRSGPVVILPTFEVPTRVKLGPFTTPTLATDVYYGDLDDDMCPDLAVGRLPAKNATELHSMLAKSIAYEGSQSFGPWRERIHATAGVGGFGMMADTAIETVTRRLLSEGIPDRFQLKMTYASPSSVYCPDPKKLTHSFIQDINRGGMFWVYIGHGNVDELDAFTIGNETLPICNSEHVSQFQVEDGPPIAILLACFTGAFDARIDCFAERLLATDRGPVAVLAGSRVTMPYGMSQLATELMDECFESKTETLGEMILNAKRKIWMAEDVVSVPTLADAQPSLRERQRSLIETMAKALSPEGHDLGEERKEHVRLMNLLGDPLLHIRHPQPISLECNTTANAGHLVSIAGDAPVAGKLIVELALMRDRLPDGLSGLSRFDGTEEQRQLMQQNYEKASNLVLASHEQSVEKGSFTTELRIPENCRGRCVVRALVYGDEDWAAGSVRVNVQRKK
jgi:hypothetical protein